MTMIRRYSFGTPLPTDAVVRPLPAESLEIVFSGGEPWLGVLGAALM